MLKTTDKNHYFLERSCEVLSPESTQGRTSTQSQEDGHSLCCSPGYHMGLALGGLKDNTASFGISRMWKLLVGWVRGSASYKGWH